ncbi:MAG TPA: hypothetical protein VII75_14610 [Thermoanaerobaculia bacterium]
MCRHSLKLLAVVLLSIAAATSAYAADDGNTQPKLNTATVGGGITSPQDIVGLTNGAGNVKDVLCTSASGTQLYAASVQIFVNGGAQQTLNLSTGQFLQDTASNNYIDIPMNVRFTSSIRVKVAGNQSGLQVSCTVSWALD